jgi:hypothetical protein
LQLRRKNERWKGNDVWKYSDVSYLETGGYGTIISMAGIQKRNMKYCSGS